MSYKISSERRLENILCAVCSQGFYFCNNRGGIKTPMLAGWPHEDRSDPRTCRQLREAKLPGVTSSCCPYKTWQTPCGTRRLIAYIPPKPFSGIKINSPTRPASFATELNDPARRFFLSNQAQPLSIAMINLISYSCAGAGISVPGDQTAKQDYRHQHTLNTE